MYFIVAISGVSRIVLKSGILGKEGAKRTNLHVSSITRGGQDRYCPPSARPKYVPGYVFSLAHFTVCWDDVAGWKEVLH